MTPTAIHIPSGVKTVDHDSASTLKNGLISNGHTPAKRDAAVSTEEAMDLEDRYGAHNYHPLPVVFDRALGCSVWDPEGREYLDCLSAYSAVNQGHCHPRIVAALTRQASRLCLSSRAFHNSLLGWYEEKITKLFGYEKVLPMNTGVEAVETALKIARKWAYERKGIPKGKAIIISAAGNFHGRTLGVVSMSTDDEARGGFGPFLQGVGPQCPVASGRADSRLVRYNHYEDLERALEAHGHEAAAVLLEPIQGEAGVVVPDDDYLPKVQALCRRHNVLLILDEVQTGFGRTGKLLCQEHSNVRADITTLGKALSGGVYPVSAVLADSRIMDVIKPGEHGSTYGGNPLACAVAMEALDVLIDENMTERAEEMGQLFRRELETLKTVGGGWVTDVRGKGLLNAIVIDDTKSKKGRGAWQLCLLMKSKGLLAKPTHINIIRLAPPLVITEEQIRWAVGVIRESLDDLDVVDEIPSETPKEKDHKQGLP